MEPGLVGELRPPDACIVVAPHAAVRQATSIAQAIDRRAGAEESLRGIVSGALGSGPALGPFEVGPHDAGQAVYVRLLEV